MTTTATTLNRSKAPPSLEGFSWRTPSAASSALRGLTRRHSPSEKPRLIELAGSCFTLVPSLPFLRQPSMTAFLHFTIRQLPSGGRGVEEEEEEVEQQLAVISPLSSAKEEGGWLNLDRSTGLEHPHDLRIFCTSASAAMGRPPVNAKRRGL